MSCLAARLRLLLPHFFTMLFGYSIRDARTVMALRLNSYCIQPYRVDAVGRFVESG